MMATWRPDAAGAAHSGSPRGERPAAPTHLWLIIALAVVRGHEAFVY